MPAIVPHDASTFKQRSDNKKYTCSDFPLSWDSGLLMTLMTCQAFVLIDSKCSFHEISLERVSPKCLWEVSCWFICRAGRIDFINFLENNTDTVFEGLEATRPVDAHVRKVRVYYNWWLHWIFYYYMYVVKAGVISIFTYKGVNIQYYILCVNE